MLEKFLAAFESIAASLKEISASLKNAAVSGKPAAAPAAGGAPAPNPPPPPPPPPPAQVEDDLGLGPDPAATAAPVKITREFLLTKARTVSEAKGRPAVKWALTKISAPDGGVKGLPENLFDAFSKALDEAPASA